MSSLCLRGLWRRGSVREGRVQVRGGVRQPHALPSEVRGARGGGLSSGFVYLLAHGARRDWSARHPGLPTAVSRVRFRSGLRVRQAHVSGSTEIPLQLPSWTHEDTSMHARERGPVSRGEARSAYNSGGWWGFIHVMVYLITRRQTWLFQRPSSLTHPLPVGSLVKGDVKGRGDDNDKGGGSWLVTI